MKKNGFTLVELLAVIVILGIIMVIVGRNLTSTKREANIKEAQKIEKTIESFGPEIYIDSGKGEYTQEDLFVKGYLKSKTIKNPAGGGTCSATLTISEGPTFEANVCCPGLYKTGEDDYKGTCD